MSVGVIERYLYDLLNAKALQDFQPATPLLVAALIINDIGVYLSDHLGDVIAARECIAVRQDQGAPALLACLDEFLTAHRAGQKAARDAVVRLRSQ